MNGKFVLINIAEDQLPVFIQVRSERFKPRYFCIVESSKDGIHIRKADAEFRRRSKEIIPEIYSDNFCG